MTPILIVLFVNVIANPVVFIRVTSLGIGLGVKVLYTIPSVRVREQTEAAYPTAVSSYARDVRILHDRERQGHRGQGYFLCSKITQPSLHLHT